MPNLACFISPHGFGHAARTCAVLQVLHEIRPNLVFHIFTRVPEWFFKDSLGEGFIYHDLLADIGLVQSSAVAEDLPATLQALDKFIPFDLSIAEEVKALACKAVLCDISPLGIAVAEKAEIPSILVENFTWDWIYDAYTQSTPGFKPIIDYLKPVFRSATYHIRARPYCADWRTPDLSAPPIARRSRRTREETRQLLEIKPGEKTVLISLGGIRGKTNFTSRLPDLLGVRFIIPGASKRLRSVRNQVHMPFHTTLFHPDLVYAADAVFSKAGYSTIAEACQSGTPFGFVPRPTFREAEVLEQFILDNLNGYRIEEEDFLAGRLLPALDHLLAASPEPSGEVNGALPAAQFIAGVLDQL